MHGPIIVYGLHSHFLYILSFSTLFVLVSFVLCFCDVCLFCVSSGLWQIHLVVFRFPFWFVWSMIAAVMHASKSPERPHPCDKPPFNRNRSDGFRFPIFSDLYCPVCRPLISLVKFGGSPSLAMQSCIVTNGIES